MQSLSTVLGVYVERLDLCLINQKGGCGKSSTCFHLAGAFASKGMRVLLVDMDPQGSLSQGLLGSTVVESLPLENTVAALFDDSMGFREPQSFLTATAFQGIDLLPANQYLAAKNTPEPELAGLLQFTLRDFLEQCMGYEVVLMDCPPNLYQCSWNAMIAASHVLIPVPPEDFGTQGLRAVHQAIESARRLNPQLRRLGHLVTRYDRRLLVHRSYEARLRTLYEQLVLETIVPEVTAYKVALACRKPVEFCDPKSSGAQAMRDLGDEILTRTCVMPNARTEQLGSR